MCSFSQFFKNFIDVWLIYTVELNSAVEKIHFFIFFSLVVYHRLLNIVPCAIQEDIAVSLSYMYLFAGRCVLTEFFFFFFS